MAVARPVKAVHTFTLHSAFDQERAGLSCAEVDVRAADKDERTFVCGDRVLGAVSISELDSVCDHTP